MTEVLWFVAIAAMLLGLLGVFLPLLPGVPLLFAGMLLAAWLDNFVRVGVPTLAILAVLGIAAWLFETLASVWGVKRAGASGLAIAGAGVGAILGIFAGLPGLGKWIFGASLILLLASLALSLREIQVSIDALTLQMADLDEHDRPAAPPASPSD